MNQCKRTYGYVKTDNNKYYRIGADGVNEEVVSGNSVSTAGVLNPATFKLNISGIPSPGDKVMDPATYKLKIKNGVDFVSDGNGSSYFVELFNNGIFLSSEDYNTANAVSKTYIVIRTVSNTIFYINFISEGIN